MQLLKTEVNWGHTNRSMYQTRLFLKCNFQDSFLTNTVYRLDGQIYIKFCFLDSLFTYEMA